MKITKEIKLAFLGIATLVILFLGYNYLKGSGIFSSTRMIKVEYDNVQGLTPANYVQLQGFTVGSVKQISLSKEHPGKVLVELLVDKTLNIPVDSKARIVSLDIMGTKAVSLILGQAKEMVQDNQQLAGDMEKGAIEALSGSAMPVMDNAKQAILTIDHTIQNVNSLIDEATKQHLRSTMANLDRSMSELTDFSKELNAQKGKISLLLNHLNEFSENLNRNNGTITNVLKNTEAATANISKLELQSSVNEMKATLENLRTTLDKLNQGNGSLALLMNDDKLYKNLKNTIATTNNLLYDFSAHPSKYIHVNIIGRKPKNEAPPAIAPNAND